MNETIDRNGIPQRLLVAVGGNATHPDDIAGTAEEQRTVALRADEALYPLAKLDNQLIVTHGNGPVVGKILMRQVLSRDGVPPMPLDICGAHSQGGIGYLLMQAMENVLRANDNPRHVAALLTQVEVDPDDAAFAAPSKPVGPFFSKEEADKISEELGWLMKEDAGRGWRHVVASPKPQHICDISLVSALAERGTVVIAVGGGGIPVARRAKGVRDGVAAVIDKDRSSALMANVLGIGVMMILTAVSKVAIHFGTPEQSELDQITVSELRKLNADGHFAAGSMGPKIDAALDFIAGGGKRVVIGHLHEAMAALKGQTGTHIVSDEQ